MRRPPSIESLPAGLRQLIADGHVVPARRDVHEVLRAIDRPNGPVTDAGTRALQEQRA